jgi:co-chaperonin GroES (HSP10)
MILPVKKHLLIKVDTPPTETEGGILLPPQTHLTEPYPVFSGKVTRAGRKCEYREGDRVIFAQYAGYRVSEDQLIMSVADVIAREV